MGRTKKYRKSQEKKRSCATSALHGVSNVEEKTRLLHARVIKVRTKRELLARIGKSPDHFNGHICTSCINDVEHCGDHQFKTVSQTVSPIESCDIGMGEIVPCGSPSTPDEIRHINGINTESQSDFNEGITCDEEFEEIISKEADLSVPCNDRPATISELPAGLEPERGSVIVLSLSNLRHDLDCLSPDTRALLAYELAAGERGKIRSDTLSVTKGDLREISSLHDICTIDYLQERNKVLSNFVIGLWSPPGQSETCPLPAGNIKARVHKQSDIYKIAKSIEACMGLTTPVAVLPFHFREIVLLYSHTHSRGATTLLASSAPHGCYQTIKNYLNNLGDSVDVSKLAAGKGDVVCAFDNNQVLQRRWNICVENRAMCSVITMVMFVNINPEGMLQFQEEFKPGNWMWENLDEQKLEQLKEGHLNPVHQDTWYIKHFHPWLTDIIQQVADEQLLVDGKFLDDVDRKVAAKKYDKDFRTCPSCQYTQVQRRKKKCPYCGKTLPSIQTSPAASNSKRNADIPTKAEGSTIRAFVKKKNDTTYNISYEKSEPKASEYSHLPEYHPSIPPEVTIGEPISLNPCSYEAIAEVFRKIGTQAGIKRYGGTREWLSIVCDGLPYILGYQLIERTFVCELCNTSVQGLSERASHQEEHQKEEPGSQCNYTQEFDWVLLQPGPGHVEMNMLKTFVKFTWPVFWEGMVELFNFRSEIAKRSARCVNDHHKGMALARIARESFAKELVLPYVRQEMLKGNTDLSVAGYLKFTMDTVESDNYALMAELTFGILDAIFLYRAGLRCGDVAMIDAGRALFARMWCARSHPLYRQLAIHDSIMTSCMPEAIRDFNNRTKSVNLSGKPHTGEGLDFKLEALNREVQHNVAANPTDKDWRHACANQPKLSKLRQTAYEELGLKDPRDYAPKSKPDLGPQIMAYRTAVRERGFISDHDKESPLTSYGNEPLDEDLVNFAETAADREKAFLESFIDHKRKGGFLKKSSITFNEAPIFVTPAERSDYNNIRTKSVKQCTEIIKTKIAGIEDDDMRKNFTTAFDIEVVSKHGKKEEYFNFFDLLEEYEMYASCDVSTEDNAVI